MAYLVDLPYELIALILSKILRLRDLSKISEVCKVFNEIAIPLLYQTLEFEVTSTAEVCFSSKDLVESLLLPGSEERLKFTEEIILFATASRGLVDSSSESRTADIDCLAEILKKLKPNGLKVFRWSEPFKTFSVRDSMLNVLVDSQKELKELALHTIDFPHLISSFTTHPKRLLLQGTKPWAEFNDNIAIAIASGVSALHLIGRGIRRVTMSDIRPQLETPPFPEDLFVQSGAFSLAEIHLADFILPEDPKMFIRGSIQPEYLRSIRLENCANTNPLLNSLVQNSKLTSLREFYCICDSTHNIDAFLNACQGLQTIMLELETDLDETIASKEARELISGTSEFPMAILSAVLKHRESLKALSLGGKDYEKLPLWVGRAFLEDLRCLRALKELALQINFFPKDDFYSDGYLLSEIKLPPNLHTFYLRTRLSSFLEHQHLLRRTKKFIGAIYTNYFNPPSRSDSSSPYHSSSEGGYDTGEELIIDTPEAPRELNPHGFRLFAVADAGMPTNPHFRPMKPRNFYIRLKPSRPTRDGTPETFPTKFTPHITTISDAEIRWRMKEVGGVGVVEFLRRAQLDI
ncbi:hypothetical protein RUND412_004724 [Rhizina undulata]